MSLTVTRCAEALLCESQDDMYILILQVYLVGDPVQLPATVISSTAVQQRYDVSMFKRLQSSGYPVNVLDVQYRMNPAISVFPSQEFYQGRLKDGEVRFAPLDMSSGTAAVDCCPGSMDDVSCIGSWVLQPTAHVNKQSTCIMKGATHCIRLAARHNSISFHVL